MYGPIPASRYVIPGYHLMGPATVAPGAIHQLDSSLTPTPTSIIGEGWGGLESSPTLASACLGCQCFANETRNGRSESRVRPPSPTRSHQSESDRICYVSKYIRAAGCGAKSPSRLETTNANWGSDRDRRRLAVAAESLKGRVTQWKLGFTRSFVC